MTDMSSDARPSVAPQGGAALASFIVFMLVLTLVQGVRAGGVPLPMILPFSLVYIVIFRPAMNPRLVTIYGIVLSYMLVVSFRNSLQPTGEVRDFLYIGVCIASCVVTVSLSDMVEQIDIRTLGEILLVCLLGEIVLLLMENLNLFGFNALARPLLDFWASLGDTVIVEGSLESRAAGSFGFPTLASVICYLIVRAAAIAMNRRGLIYLVLVPLLLTGARTTLLLFLIWDVAVPLLLSPRRKQIFLIIASVLLLAAGVAVFIPDFYSNVFIFAQFIRFDSLQLVLASDSVFNRLFGFRWALDHWVNLLTVGGITSADFSAYENRVFPIDSELVLRSLQFGIIGFALLCTMNLWQGYNRKDPDWWFGVFLVLGTSLVNSTTTQFLVLPFLILYNVVIKKAREAYAPVTPRGAR
jgi:hypothetical protein